MISLLTFLGGPIGRWLVIIVLVMAAAGTAALKFYNSGIAHQQAEDAREVADANANSRRIEQDGRDRMNQLAIRHYKEESNANIENDRLRADLASGARKLSIRLSAPVPACEDRSTPTGSGSEARADIDPGTATALVSLTKRGDDAIRQSNALIDAYAVAQSVCGK